MPSAVTVHAVQTVHASPLPRTETSMEDNLTMSDVSKTQPATDTGALMAPMSSSFLSSSSSSSSSSSAPSPGTSSSSSTTIDSTIVLSSLTGSASPLSEEDIESLVAQKQHQLAYFQRQQQLQQTQQRHLLFHHQQLRQKQQQHQQRLQEKQRQQFHDAFHCSHQRGLYQQLRQGQGQGQGQGCGKNSAINSDGTVVSKSMYDQEYTTASSASASSSSSSVASSACTNSEGATDSIQKSSASRMGPDLVDDVWRLIYYILAGDCRDLGRTMLVNRRFYNMISNDAVLWRLTYNLTVSESIFSSQKPLLSPTWIREEHNHLFANGLLEDPSSVVESLGPDQAGMRSSRPSLDIEDMNEDGPAAHIMLINGAEPRHKGTHRVDIMNHMDASFGSTGSSADSTNEILDLQPRRGSLTMNPGLQIPSPMVLPHHRRIVQNITATNANPGSNAFNHDHPNSGNNCSSCGGSGSSSYSNNSSNSVGVHVNIDHSIDPHSFSMSATTSTSSSSSLTAGLVAGSTQTPASTPASSSIPSFQSTFPPSVSQVVSSSTTPLSVIQHHFPTTTLMHHHPAVYWKYQVVEWLEQEKLRCLRLGLFWGFNAAASRAHGRGKKIQGDGDR